MQKRRTEKDLMVEAVATTAEPSDVLEAEPRLRAAAGSKTAIVAYGKRLTPVVEAIQVNDSTVVVVAHLHHPTKGLWGDSYTLTLTWANGTVTCQPDATLLSDGSIADRKQCLAVREEVRRVLQEGAAETANRRQSAKSTVSLSEPETVPTPDEGAGSGKRTSSPTAPAPSKRRKTPIHESEDAVHSAGEDSQSVPDDGFECIECDASVPAGADACPSCGWSWQ